MPYSSHVGKAESYNWIVSTFQKDIEILDVGPGDGGWGINLKKYGYTNIDAVEIWGPYVRQYHLPQLYRKVFISDITCFLSERKYDLVIFGDIIEHLPVDEAQRVLNRYKGLGSKCLVSVPWRLVSGEYEGNIHETHLQDDLTKELAIERYGPDIEWLYADYCMGVFVV